MTDNEQFKFSEQVFLRAPFYSFQDYCLGKLPRVLGEETFRAAIWLASPALYRELEKKDFDFGRLDGKARFSLAKYYNRMSFRPTPFGAFASFTLLGWADAPEIALVKGDDAILHLQPALARQSATNAWLRQQDPDPQLLASPNLYRQGRQWRYHGFQPDASGRMNFSLSAIEAGRVNNQLLRAASGAPVPYSVLQNNLSAKTGCSPAEAAAYLDFLLAEQVLLTTYGAALIETRTEAVYRGLSRPFKEHAVQLNKNAVPAAAPEDETIPLTGSPPCYTALERPALHGGADRLLQTQLAEVLGVLRRIVPPSAPPALQSFRVAFQARFEGRKIPLLTALDPDAGVGYASLHGDAGDPGLLAGLRFPGPAPAGKELPWTEVHRLLLRTWLQNSAREPFDPVRLRETDISELPLPEASPLPPSLAMMFSRSAGRLVMESAGGASATALLGRFSLFSRGVHDHCRKIAEAESRANPDVIFAELHQVSHLRVDDISRRRPIYDQVIPVNTYPSLPGLRHILPADLLLSVSGDTLILESASLGKRVIPRLPTAYNYSHSDMALFRLLCDLQYQGLQAGLNFDPEQLFPGLDFYPRIEYRDVVLAPAKWKLTKVALAPLLAGPPSISRLHLFRQEKGLPRHIASGTGDQQLVFDLGRDEEALFFLEQLRGQDGATLREYFFPDTYVKSNRCPLTGQFIVVWLQESRVYTGLPEVHTVASIKTPRSFLPGSEWLYVKLYCAPESATAVLLQVVLPFLQRNADSIRCWFFIRYQDPGPHLRFRVRTAEGEAVSLMSALGRLVSMGEHRELVREHRADTYHRELERYSPELMEDVELFFRAGSDWVLRYLVKKNAPGQEVFAELAPFVLVYRWCRVFVPEITDLVAFLDRLKKHYLKEFGGDRQLLVGLDRKYRGLSGAFRAVLENTPATGPDDHWTDMCIGDIAALNLRAAAWPAPKREKLLADLVHMQVNRIYASGQRRYEGVIYYCLHKYAASVLARQV